MGWCCWMLKAAAATAVADISFEQIYSYANLYHSKLMDFQLVGWIRSVAHFLILLDIRVSRCSLCRVSILLYIYIKLVKQYWWKWIPFWCNSHFICKFASIHSHSIGNRCHLFLPLLLFLPLVLFCRHCPQISIQFFISFAPFHCDDFNLMCAWLLVSFRVDDTNMGKKHTKPYAHTYPNSMLN